ncbi:MAG TPA: CPXCG motif-containing cysteine-rich protein [Gammaproteobacteria bacterium]|nr:CPXCG motif-containing cysteine-rich protein [Gammaproteobacteria bacterium]
MRDTCNKEIQCPYCWEMIDVIIDDCGEDQQYIEDCQVCCRPINFHITINEDLQPQLRVLSEDE